MSFVNKGANILFFFNMSFGTKKCLFFLDKLMKVNIIYIRQNCFDQIIVGDKLMTMERGASEREEESAKKMIEKLRSKANETSEKYIVTGIIPGHMANPPRMNWHIEKDGVYVAKENGILKFAHIDNYYRYESCMKDMQNFKTTKREEYRNSLISEYMRRWNDTEERAAEQADSHIESVEKDKALMD